MKVFIFGTFNPATNAHINMGITAKNVLADKTNSDVDIIYVPTCDNYIGSWKGYHKGSIMPGNIRVQLLTDAVKEYEFSVSDIEVAGIVDGKTLKILVPKNVYQYLRDNKNIYYR